MSDYDNEINPGMPEEKKMGKDIKIPKSWKELENENAQLRAELEKWKKTAEFGWKHGPDPDELEQLRAALAAKEAELEGEKKITAQWAEKSGELAAQIMKARKVIQAYSDYHEGEYEEMPEQRAGRRWLAVHPADTKEVTK